MKNYLVEFEYEEARGGDIDFSSDATDMDQVENEAVAYIREVFPDAMNIRVTAIQETNI